MAHRIDVVVLTGSLPPGTPDDLFATLIADVAPRPTILDSSGEGLRRRLAASPTVAKPNRLELEEAGGRRLRTLRDVADAGQRLRDRGVAWVVITLAEKGAVVVCADGAWHVRAPPAERINAVGAGDALAAGLAVGLARSLAPLEAARLGVAAAAADVRTELPGDLTIAMVAGLTPDVSVRRLRAAPEVRGPFSPVRDRETPDAGRSRRRRAPKAASAAPQIAAELRYGPPRHAAERRVSLHALRRPAPAGGSGS